MVFHRKGRYQVLRIKKEASFDNKNHFISLGAFSDYDYYSIVGFYTNLRVTF